MLRDLNPCPFSRKATVDAAQKRQAMIVREKEKAVAYLVLNGVSREAAELALQHFIDAVLPAKTPKLPTRRPAQPDIAAPIVQQYCALYQQMYHQQPPVNSNDFVIVHRLLRQFKPDVVSAHMNAFAEFYQCEAWLNKRVGFSIPLFAAQWKAVVAFRHSQQPRLGTPRDCRHEPICQNATDHTQRMLADLRGSYDPTKSSLRTVLKPSAAP